MGVTPAFDRIGFVCARCHGHLVKRLDLITSEISFFHKVVSEDDVFFHDPVPVPAKPEDWICDICTLAPPRWHYYGGKPFTIDMPFAPGHVYDDNGEWGLCDDCHRIAQTGSWQQLARIIWRMLLRKNPSLRPQKPMFMELYREQMRLFVEGRNPAGPLHLPPYGKPIKL